MIRDSKNRHQRTRILITGGSGFVGRKIVEALMLEDVQILAVVRAADLNPDTPLNKIDTIISSADIFSESADWWANVCEDIDLVIHTAWYAQPGKYLQSAKNIECLEGSLNLARGAAVAGVKRFIGLGTCFEYEMSDSPLTTTDNQLPLTLYASAKLSLYFLLNNFFESENVEFAWCRLFYLFGDGEDSRRFIPYLREKLKRGEIAELTSGRQVRDYLNVIDAGREIAEIALSTQQGIFNICSGVPITIREIAENIADEYGRRDLLKFGARQDNLVDPPYVVGVPNYIRD